MELEITKMTSRGQVVIPQGIREVKKFKEGERFIVYDIDDAIILKRIQNLEQVKGIKEFDNVFKSMWKTAKARKITKKDVDKEIKAYRKEKNA